MNRSGDTLSAASNTDSASEMAGNNPTKPNRRKRPHVVRSEYIPDLGKHLAGKAKRPKTDHDYYYHAQPEKRYRKRPREDPSDDVIKKAAQEKRPREDNDVIIKKVEEPSTAKFEPVDIESAARFVEEQLEKEMLAGMEIYELESLSRVG